MDRVVVFGTNDEGSNPSGGTFSVLEIEIGKIKKLDIISKLKKVREGVKLLRTLLIFNFKKSRVSSSVASGLTES